MQETLLDLSGVEGSRSSFPTWPKQVTWDERYVWELPTSEHPTSVTGSSSSPELLLPSPSSAESTPTEEFVDEVREHLDDPHSRLYLPGRKWHSQRTLSRIVPALLPPTDDEMLPTPGAWLGRRPENATADPERAASRENEGVRGKRSVELPDALAAEVTLLPTPVVTDSFGSRRATARTDEWTSNEGTTLTDALWQVEGRTTDTLGNLLPTPAARDGKGLDVDSKEGGPSLPQAARNLTPEGDRRHLLPTPVANTENPGAGGELRAAITHGPTRRNETGIDTLGRPNSGRPAKLLPTPEASDGTGGRVTSAETYAKGKRPSGAKAATTLRTALEHETSSGGSTSPPSDDGSGSSDDPPHGQLTIGDA